MKKFIENHGLFILFLKMAVILCGAMILGLLMRGIGVLLLRYWLEVNESIIILYDITLVLLVSKVAYHVCHETYLQAKTSGKAGFFDFWKYLLFSLFLIQYK